MRRSILFAAIIPLLGLALSACGPSGPTTIVANPQPPQRTLNVTGTGMVTLTPDIAYVNIGVHNEMATATEAVAANNTQTQQVADSLKASGVDPKDIRTANFSIYPNVQYDPQTSQKIGTTYVVDNTVYVTVHNLDKLGDLLDAAVKAGANSVNSIQFDLADKSAALKDARDKAVKDARSQAEGLAATSGVKLGDLQNVNFNNMIPTPIMESFGKGGGGAAEAAATVPVSPGQMILTVTVNMTYEIK